MPYHQRTVAYFQQQQALWHFFSDPGYRVEQLQEFKLNLLKNTYKFDPAGDAGLYARTEQARTALGLETSVFLYQAQHAAEMNATVAYLNEEAHIVFSGKILELLTPEEQLAVIAHELAHVLLFRALDSAVEVADRVITAIASNPGSTTAHYETARLFKLYTEIYCDRGAYQVTGSYAPIVSSLVKLATGLQTVNADGYIRQAEEIFAVDAATRATGVSHPENFIRARALWLWHDAGAGSGEAIREMIEGNTGIDELDLFRQQQVASITESLLQLLLEEGWMQTPATLALRSQYFPELDPRARPEPEATGEKIRTLHASLKDYLAYVLYDFSVADKTLEDLPLGRCFGLADRLQLGESFAQTVKKERKLTDKKLAALKKEALKSCHRNAAV